MASQLETFIELLKTLPNDFSRELTMVSVLDEKIELSKLECKTYMDALRKLGTERKKLTKDEYISFSTNLVKLRQSQDLQRSFSMEKVEVLKQAVFLVKSYNERLGDEMKRLAAELDPEALATIHEEDTPRQRQQPYYNQQTPINNRHNMSRPNPSNRRDVPIMMHPHMSSHITNPQMHRPPSQIPPQSIPPHIQQQHMQHPQQHHRQPPSQHPHPQHPQLPIMTPQQHQQHQQQQQQQQQQRVYQQQQQQQQQQQHQHQLQQQQHQQLLQKQKSMKQNEPPNKSTIKIIKEEARTNDSYCLCGKGDENGTDYIGCDNDKCPIGWFHLSCVGLQDASEDENWYCLECIKKQK